MIEAEKAKDQIDKFREAARQLETDDSEERFAETVKRIGQAKSSRVEPTKKRPPKEEAL